MLPKNSNHFILPTAEKLGISKELVSDVVGFCYADLRKKLTNLEYPYVNVPGLGVFTIMKSRIPNKIKDYETQIGSSKLDTPHGLIYKDTLRQRLLNLQGCLDTINAMNIKKLEVLQIQKAYVDNLRKKTDS